MSTQLRDGEVCARQSVSEMVVQRSVPSGSFRAFHDVPRATTRVIHLEALFLNEIYRFSSFAPTMA
jgi:hypothetical protein